MPRNLRTDGPHRRPRPGETHVADFGSVRERRRDLRVIHGSNTVVAAASTLRARPGKVAKQI
jgi:hypothetical protein